jgi:protein-L-isoaspartate(D-aspartate) O-methyltransferase
MDRSAQLRSELVAYLRGRYAIWSPEWTRAFLTVPRHLFVPRFSHTVNAWAPDPQHEELDGSIPEQHDRWLELAYSDSSLVIPSESGGRASSSQPSTMAYMLEALEVEDGNRVLEVGLGSGYQAALLAEHVGAESVTSIDIDPVVHQAAERHLAAAGYAPHVAVADGVQGYPDRAPYDRVIGAVYGWPIPPAWIEQITPGGRLSVIAPSSLARLRVHEDGRAEGRLHWSNFSFMFLRGYNPEYPSREDFMTIRTAVGDSRSSRHPIRILEAGGHQRSFWVLVGMLVQPYEGIQSVAEGVTVWLDPQDRSWAVLDHEHNAVTQGGPRRLWDRVEELYDQWCQLGGPNRERFGLTVLPDGRHWLWLDEPDSEHRWDVTPTPTAESLSSRTAAGPGTPGLRRL